MSRLFVADAHRGDGKRFIAHADEKLTAFLESRQEPIKKNCAVVAGFRRPFPLYQMNRRKQKTRQKNQTESKPQKRKQ
jgi:hypothetical protein